MKFRTYSGPPGFAPQNSPKVEAMANQHKRQRLRRYVVIAALILIGICLYYINESWITADGVVIGDLAPVTPISTVRINNLHVKCLDFVSKGQSLADVVNDSNWESAQQQLQALSINLAQSKSDSQIADAETNGAQKFYLAQAALRDQLVSVLKAQTELLKGNYVASLVWQQAKANVDQAEANAAAAEYDVQSKMADKARADLSAKLTQQQIELYQKSPVLLGHYTLVAPKSGFLTQCNAEVGSVVDNTVSLFQIFNPTDGYIIAFVQASDAQTLKPGMEFDIQIAGISDKIKATVGGFYPEYSGLPSMLVHYFWQNEQWTQYEPVRLNFSSLNDDQMHALRASAEVSVSRWQPPETGLFAPVTKLLSSINNKT